MVRWTLQATLPSGKEFFGAKVDTFAFVSGAGEQDCLFGGKTEDRAAAEGGEEILVPLPTGETLEKKVFLFPPVKELR